MNDTWTDATPATEGRMWMGYVVACLPWAWAICGFPLP